MKNLKFIESFLPVFTGFYGTVFEANEDMVIEEPYSYDDYKFDYRGYEKDCGIKCTKVIQDKLNEIGKFGVKIEYQNTSSPREYNFTNDSINVKFILSKGTTKKIEKYLSKNAATFAEYIKKHYTSRDGFMSFYSNDAKVWLNEYLNDEKKLEHCFGTILEFIFDNEGYTDYNLYEDIADSVYLSGELIATAE
jgi:hypothetical protein